VRGIRKRRGGGGGVPARRYLSIITAPLKEKSYQKLLSLRLGSRFAAGKGDGKEREGGEKGRKVVPTHQEEGQGREMSCIKP